MDYQGCSVISDFLHANGHVVLERVGKSYNLRSFTQKEIEEITNGYCDVLGEGGFGKVYRGKLDDLRTVAVKRYKNGTKKEEFAKEVIVHSQINHKNVVKLLGCCTEENALTIVMEFVCNGSLYNTLHCSNANGPVPFPLEKRLDIAIESAEVLSCMHSMFSPVLHGDVKTANILLDENLQAKLSDFGIARFLLDGEDQHTRYVIGCIGYMDPLFCQSGILTPKSDVYSFGVVLLEIITRKKAVDGNIILAQSFADVLRKGKKVRQMFDEEIADGKTNMKLLEDIAKVAAECLKMEVKMRPEMVEVADRLRAIRKVLHQRKGISSKGSKSGPSGSGKAKDVLSPTKAKDVLSPTKAKDVLSAITPTPVNDTDKTSSSVAPTISMDELNKITRNFSNGALIGEGSYSDVYLGVLKDGQKSAIKRVKHTSSRYTIFKVPDISRFKHENVIQLHGYCVEGDNRVLVYEYTSGGSLHDILHGKKNARRARPGPVLSWAKRMKIAVCAAIGLQFLHEKAQPSVIHCGIKSSNIFLFDGDVAKIGGLRVFRQADDYRDNLLLDSPFPSSGYRAPEYEMEEGQLNTKSDVYSFGVVLLELLTGRRALDRTLPRTEQYLVAWASSRLGKRSVRQCVDRRLEGHYPPKAATELAAIAELCVRYHMDRRPNMSSVVSALKPLLVGS